MKSEKFLHEYPPKDGLGMKISLLSELMSEGERERTLTSFTVGLYDA